MLSKKLVILIIFFYPILLVAQQSTKNNSKVNGVLVKKKIRKNTYSDDEIRLAKMTKPVTDKMNSIYKLARKKNDELVKLSDSSAKNILQQSIDSLNKIAEQLNSQLTTVQFNFIRSNSSSLLSLDRLSMILTRSAELPLYIDTIGSLFNHLNKNIQNSVTGRQLQLLLVNVKKSKVGSLAPDFTVNDINSHPLSLSSYRDKEYVLLDFWASWCIPCRDDIPFLKDIYKRYNEKGLEIIGISKDDNSSLWKNAIVKDSTQIWRHILVQKNKQKNDSSITDNYFVYGIPVKVLINREGVIIGRWSGSGEENITELKKLLNKVFDE